MRDTPVIAEFREQQGWTELHTLIKIRRQREIDGRRTDEVSYYISSLREGAATVLQAVVPRWYVRRLGISDHSGSPTLLRQTTPEHTP